MHSSVVLYLSFLGCFVNMFISKVPPVPRYHQHLDPNSANAAAQVLLAALCVGPVTGRNGWDQILRIINYYTVFWVNHVAYGSKEICLQIYLSPTANFPKKCQWFTAKHGCYTKSWDFLPLRNESNSIRGASSIQEMKTLFLKNSPKHWFWKNHGETTTTLRVKNTIR